MITREIAEMLVKETSKVMNLNINVMNDKGVIIATRNPSRLNSIHEGAIEVVASGKALEITVENQGNYRGTQLGINLPIYFHNEVVGVIGITGDPGIISDRGGLVKMMAELLVKQTYMASQSEWRQRTKEMIVEELLKDHPNRASIERWFGLLDLKPESPFTVSLIEMNDDAFSSHMVIENAREGIGAENMLAVFIDVNKLLLLLMNTAEESAVTKLAWLNKRFEKSSLDFRMAYSTTFDNLFQTNQGVRECEIALAVSRSESGQKMISYVDIEPKALIYQIDPRLAEPFCERILQGDLINYLETLQAFFDANLNIKEAANKLFIHRNTLIYRLNKIKSECGFDPQNFKDAFALQMVIWLNKKEHERLTNNGGGPVIRLS